MLYTILTVLVVAFLLAWLFGRI
ncbi:hypothetical protein BH780_gp010 [Bacillus phage Eldridge]|uniref:Uncharacterized protein n=1 Tax=Bacillus phage Eldridge TaxID=1776293 RepID=A0A109QIS0_9CAUD|nr:hypothetical protein BH780_gp010 [Bacillus phage Eldridge]AMB18593.1 hypothetical protein Eldridge_010 [Bacillus phage Eldridge]